MLKFIRLLALVATASFAAAPAMAATADRAQVIRDLQVIKSENTLALQELEKRIQSRLDPSPQTLLAVPLDEKEIEKLTELRRERLWRQDFLDRLILQVDTKFTSGDLRLFLSDRLAEMARSDLLSRESGQNLWKQMTYMSQALRDMPERDANVVGFVEDYLKNSSFQHPMRPEDFLKGRQYTNGRESVAAASPNLDQAGEIVESQIKKKRISDNSGKP